MKIGTVVKWTLLSLSVFVLIAFVTVTIIFRGSLPQLDGEQQIAGLSHSVKVERDRNGMATITAADRVDLAQATGFVHAQERFYQMDLLRRNSAGELSQLFGEVALNHDKKLRAHRFRHKAELAYQNLSVSEQGILLAYTKGVNQGLNGLSQFPFEYQLLRQKPVNWSTADTFLVVYSMYLDLQDGFGDREIAMSRLKGMVDQAVFDALIPSGGHWNATIDDSDSAAPKLPEHFMGLLNTAFHQPISHPIEPDYMPGSNNWAVSGDVTSNGAAILADDMHLGIRVPNTWYKVRFKFQENNQPNDIVGLSLPGTPNIIVGSNKHVAWGFTNSYGDWSDVIALQLSEDRSQYLTPNGYQAFEIHDETIHIAGRSAEIFRVKETIWGPVIADSENEVLAYKWVAHTPTGINLNIINLEQVKTVEEAAKVATTMGIPAQNMMMADKDGSIGWTIAGAIPTRSESFDRNFISDWSNIKEPWHGFLHSTDYPKHINPPSNRLWTANSRVVGNDDLAKIGDGGYALGARAKQIKEGLFAIDSFDEQDLLDIQLDDRAQFLSRWHQFLLSNVIPNWDNAARERLTIELENWSASASVDDLGYLIVNQFRYTVRRNLFAPLFDELREKHPGTKLRHLNRKVEYAMWQLINTEAELQPLLHKSLNQVLTKLDKEFGQWESATWGKFNAVNIRHPMSQFIPLIGHLTDMEKQVQPGDTYMPRVAGPDFGASQRLVVSPGYEENGILHMPSSQSGHPLSPYYGSGHQEWLEGKTTPLLPLETKYVLNLLPTTTN